MISFIWEGKQESYEKAFESTNKTLQANKEVSINFDTTNNLYIEGDNIDALKLLEKEYTNKIKMIYIDPPYNTGRKNLTYSDNFRYDKETNDNINWLNMIYPRLLLAKKLLTEDGVIFISIDDKQFADLKVICDEIFGAYNYIPFIWNKKNQPSGCTTLNKKIDIKTEHVLCYQNNINSNPFKPRKYNKEELIEQGYVLRDEFFDERGAYKLVNLEHTCSVGSFQYISSLDYELQAPDGTYFKIHKNTIKPMSMRYTWSKKLFDFGLANGFIEFKKHKDGYWQVFRKNYEKVGIDPKAMKIIHRSAGVAYDNLLLNMTSSIGAADLRKLDMHNFFSSPKPVKLLKHLINMCTSTNDIVLDFFAGSSTTAHAVLELNKENKTNLSFIMVQKTEECSTTSEAYKNGFKTISAIGLERIKRIGTILKEQCPELDTGFKYYKVI